MIDTQKGRMREDGGGKSGRKEEEEKNEEEAAAKNKTPHNDAGNYSKNPCSQQMP